MKSRSQIRARWSPPPKPPNERGSKISFVADAGERAYPICRVEISAHVLLQVCSLAGRDRAVTHERIEGRIINASNAALPQFLAESDFPGIRPRHRIRCSERRRLGNAPQNVRDVRDAETEAEHVFLHESPHRA